MAGVEIQNSDSLIWVLRYPERFSVQDVRQLFREMRHLNPELRKHAVLVDMSAVNPLAVSAAVRRDAPNALHEDGSFLNVTCLAMARVAPNPIGRGMLTVFDWMTPKPWPVDNFYSGEAAELWLRGHLAKLGYSPPTENVWAPAASDLRSGYR